MDMKDAYQSLYDQLESTGLEVMLSPAPQRMHEEHYVRVAIAKNPTWYQELCSKYPSTRGDNPMGKRTKIKRREILRILSRLTLGKPCKSQYVPDLERIATDLTEHTPF